MFTFLSHHAFSTTFVVKDSSKTIQGRNFIFGIHVDNGKLYRGIENEPSPICSFFFFLFFSSEISSQLYNTGSITQEAHILYIV